jgi:hypothetical protein
MKSLLALMFELLLLHTLEVLFYFRNGLCIIRLATILRACSIYSMIAVCNIFIGLPVVLFYYYLFYWFYYYCLTIVYYACYIILFIYL